MRQFLRVLCLLLFLAPPALAQLGPVMRSYGRRVRAVASAADPYWTDTNSYVGLWEMETTNTIATLDTSGNSYHATNKPNVTTGPAWTIVGTNSQGRVEHGFTLDGSADYFSLPTNTVLYGTNAFTVGTWFKVNTLPSGIYCFYSTRNGTPARGWEFTMEGASAAGAETLVLRNREGGTSVVSPRLYYATNQWYFASATHVSGAQKLYLNGVQVYATNLVQSFTASGVLPLIGSSGTTLPTPLFPGVLDNMFITDYVMTSNSIYQLYQYTHPTNNLRKRP